MLLANYRILLLLFLLFGASVARSEGAAELKIGYVTDLSGIGSFFGVQSQRGASLAERELVSSGSKIKIIFEDSGGRTTDALTVVERLISIEHVDIIFCDLTVVCTAISSRVRAAGKILIYHSPARSIKAANPLALRNFIDYQDACRLIAQYWRQRGLKFGGLAVNLEFGDSCLAGMKEIDPRVFIYQYNPGDDLRSAVSTFKSKQIEAVVHVGFERDFQNWFRIGAEQSYDPIQGFIEIMLSETIVKGNAGSIEGSTIAGYQDLPRSFVETLKREVPSKDEVNIQGAALAYNAVIGANKAFAACPDKANRCLLDQLKIQRSDALLGHRGWNDEATEYPVVLKEWRSGGLQPLSR